MKTRDLFLSSLILVTAAALSSCGDEIIQGDSCIQEDINTPTTLENRVSGSGADYCIEGDVYVNAALTIEPGVIIEMGPGASLLVEENGSLNAQGTASNPIVFTGRNAVVGYWGTLNFQSNNSNNRLDYVTVEYGGNKSGYEGAVHLEYGASVRITNSTVRSSQKNGIFAYSSDISFPAFNNNTISNCGLHPLVIFPGQLNSIGTSNTLNNGNVYNRVYVFSGTILQPATIYNIGVPYECESFNIESDVTVQAGVQMQMRAAARIEVEANGSLACNGTANSPVVFTGTNNSPGFWNAVSMESVSSNNQFTYTQFLYGGKTGQGYDGMAYLYEGSATYTNCTFSHSQTYGVFEYGNGSFIDGGGNTFSNNALGDFGN